jgi:hypothetical protein
MNPTLLEIGVALFMLAVVVALFVWFARFLRASSGRRMARMLARAGVSPDIVARGDQQAVIDDIRRRCMKCQAEDQCERWLTGKVEGDNSFCPNARIFSALTARQPALG